MTISPISFSGTIYLPNQKLGINTDHVTKFKNGNGGCTQVYFSDQTVEKLHVPIDEFNYAYQEASARKDKYVELKNSKPIASI